VVCCSARMALRIAWRAQTRSRNSEDCRRDRGIRSKVLAARQCPKRERYLTHRESVGSPHFRLPALDPYGKRKGRRVWEQAPFPDLPSVRKRAGQIQSSSDSVARPRHLSDSAPSSCFRDSLPVLGYRLRNRDFLRETMHRRASQRAVSTRHWIGNDQGGALRRHGYPRHHLQKIQSKH